jgi:hypothetical protein
VLAILFVPLFFAVIARRSRPVARVKPEEALEEEEQGQEPEEAAHA